MRISKISCLCPAQDWFAVYLLEAEPWYSLSRLAAFMVGRVEEYQGKYPHGHFKPENEDRVEGVVAGEGNLQAASMANNFWGYLHKDDIDEEIKAMIKQEALEYRRLK